ncbi:bifunctional hydroxymethylpyrimidine kinase/phosphomethylpyrimidine kinase [Senegalia sp. (in: firmicutes)]|uniref:bifunctional hydroxymethylpyrimidine kinase/phosphomethylpyrimidine kinase n=1 Tax=Senegalia sp. (in: firmicutes) TaxID=1924098 RepID=UPI003F9725FD
MKKVLTIAGSDCSGGAGIQADIKTITAHKMYAMSAITALTAQNTTGVYGVNETSPEFVSKQLDCIFEDIFPNAIKIGMVSSKEIIEAISKKLKEYKGKNIVVDPVMFSTSGHKLMSEDAMDALKTKLLPLADIITPNIFEAESLCGFNIRNKDDMIKAAKEISKFLDAHILIKGGHFTDSADDLLFYKGSSIWFNEDRIDNPNTHGTGCTLSSAIACNLGKGLKIEESVRDAKKYITRALQSGLDIGSGSGPLNHCV